MILEFNGKKPKIAENVFVAPNAVIIGDVTLEESVSVWYGAVLRGDIEPIVVKRYSNIQDNCTIHTSKGFPVIIGECVTIGHNAIIHGCEIGDEVLIGMNVTILDGSRIGSGCIVAAGSVIKERSFIEPLTLVAGVPAQPKKKLNSEIKITLKKHAKSYYILAKDHKKIFE